MPGKWIVRLLLLWPLLALGIEAEPVTGDDSGEFHVVLTGDSILNRRLSIYSDTEYAVMFRRIRDADAAFTNLETVIEGYQSPGAPVSGGTYQSAPRWAVEEVKWAGFKLISVANNHAFDFGADGLRSTLGALDSAGLVYAGAGGNLALARAASYLDTAHGRIALVACASTFAAGSLAGTQRPDLSGRPGINPLRHITIYTVDAPLFEGLRRLAFFRGLTVAGGSNVLQLDGDVYELGTKIDVRTVPFQVDLNGIVRAVRDARRQADWVIMSIHSHESKPGSREMPADFLPMFSQAVVDAGADIVVAHGSHILRGIELYKGRPIFYGLGNFVFHDQTARLQPAESYEQLGLPQTATPADYFDARSGHVDGGVLSDRSAFESAIVEVVFTAARTLSEIRLYPISLGFGEPRSQRGRPRPSTPDVARRIILHSADLSRTYGTQIEYTNGYGTVRIKLLRNAKEGQ